MIILNRAKDYYENIMKIIKKRLRDNARDKYRNLSEEEKIERESMEEIDTITCLKKKNKN